jgi:hypothetical protein
MAKRLGAVVIFKPHVTREQAVLLLTRLENVLDLERMARPIIQEFDPDIGSPVWYVP